MADYSLRNNPISNAIFGQPVSQQPGAGGKLNLNDVQGQARLKKDPQTGLYFDPTTGTTYMDPTGQQVVTNPNVAQQVATNFARSQQFNNALLGLNTERSGIVGNEGKLVTDLQRQAAGLGPSVSQMQLGEGLNQIASQQNSQAASVAGPSSPLAQLLAMRNTGSASTAANNAAAQGRIMEQRNAQNALSQLLGQMGSQTESALGRTTNAGLNYANLASGGEEAQQGLNQKADSQRAQDESNFGASIIKGIAGYAAA